MKVSITLDFDDKAREALNAHVGQPGPATRQEIRGWMAMTLQASLEVIVADLDGQKDDEESV